MGLNTGGIIFMSFAYVIILMLVSYCYYKVFKTEGKK
jgi:hypothetical protein